LSSPFSSSSAPAPAATLKVDFGKGRSGTKAFGQNLLFCLRDQILACGTSWFPARSKIACGTFFVPREFKNSVCGTVFCLPRGQKLACGTLFCSPRDQKTRLWNIVIFAWQHAAPPHGQRLAKSFYSFKHFSSLVIPSLILAAQGRTHRLMTRRTMNTFSRFSDLGSGSVSRSHSPSTTKKGKS
jgi:hypothetical protein